MRWLTALLIFVLMGETVVEAGPRVETVIFDQPKYYFTVFVPVQWKINETETKNDYNFVAYNGKEVFAVMIEEPTEFSNRIQIDIEDGQFGESYKLALKNEFESRSIKRNVSFSVATIANKKWLMEMCSVSRTTLDSTVFNSMTIFSRVHRGKNYSIQFIGGPAVTVPASLEKLKEANVQYFDAILKSFWIY